MTESDVLAEATATYQPKTGGIHPREAAQHHAANIASAITKAIRIIPDVWIEAGWRRRCDKTVEKLIVQQINP